MKTKSMKKGFALMLLSILLTLCFGMTVFAAEINTESTAVDGTVMEGEEESLEEMNIDQELIMVRIKATVSEGFNGNVVLKYVGKTAGEIQVTLTPEKNYTLVVTTIKDVYTLKYANAGEGYSVTCADAFSTLNATADNTYILSAKVSKSSAESAAKSVKVRIQADAASANYSGDIDVKYTGTNGNTIIASLTANNNYTMDLSAVKDIYTLEMMNIDDGFTCKPQYSFTLENASDDNIYLLSFNVKKAKDSNVEVLDASVNDAIISKIGQEVEVKEEENTEKQKITFSLKNPEQSNITGKVYISFAGDNGNLIEKELSKENDYTVTTNVPQDTYKLIYCNYYDDDSIKLQSSLEVINADGVAGEIPVNISVIGENAGSKSDNEGKSYTDLMFYGAIVVAALAFYFIKVKGKGKGNSNKKDKVKDIDMDDDDNTFEDEEDDDDDDMGEDY